MGLVDLHIHTTASDGRFPPAEIVRMAAELGLIAMAITDHDTLDGIPEALAAAGQYPAMAVIPGIEINTDVSTGEAHVLGYFIDCDHREMQSTLQRLRESRQERGQKMLAKLERLGVHLDWERVKEIAGPGSIGRPHIAQAMLEKGYIANIKEAFVKYIGWGGPAYVEREKITPAEATELILRAGGLPVLAHPLTISEPERMIAELKQHGLLGIEAYYNNYDSDDVSRLLELAAKYDLMATGGSDFHGLDLASEVRIGGPEVPNAVAEKLISLARQRGCLKKE